MSIKILTILYEITNGLNRLGKLPVGSDGYFATNRIESHDVAITNYCRVCMWSDVYIWMVRSLSIDGMSAFEMCAPNAK